MYARAFLSSFRRKLIHRQPSETAVLSGLAVAVGLLTGGGVWLFKRGIELAHRAAFDGLGARLSPLGGWTVVLVPVVAGLIVGLIMHYLVGPERHHGVAGVMEAVALVGGRLRWKRIPLKALAAALSIGGGASVGPEDPSVQIGANAGSMLGQLLRLSDEQVRTLAAAGAAAGIAAAFNAPIAGVFFALEIILGEFSTSAFGVVLAAVISAMVTQALSGSQPAFAVPSYSFHSLLELPFYLGLGLLAGPMAALYIRSLFTAQDLFRRLKVRPWLKPATAGLLVGVIGLLLPQIFGVGYDTISRIFSGPELPLGLLLALLAAKLLATSVSIGGGFPGGVFAPSLFLGAALGGAFGHVAGMLFPGLSITAAAFAMVGMAAVLAGSVHAPLTAILLLFEMTNDYRIILPLMLAVIVSLVISRHMQRESVYTLSLARKGIRLERGRDVEVLEGLKVSEVMEIDNILTMAESTPLTEAVELFARSRHHGMLVVNASGELAGVLTIKDLDNAQAEGEVARRTAGEACTRELTVAYPDESIGAALRRMSLRDIGRIPVVARDNPRRLVGLLRRSDMVRAYDIALSRRATALNRANQVRLGAFGGVGVTDMTIAEGAPCAGKRISEVAWPHESVIATLRRRGQLIIPHGETVLRPGDVLVIVAEGPARDAVLKLCRGEKS